MKRNSGPGKALACFLGFLFIASALSAIALASGNGAGVSVLPGTSAAPAGSQTVDISILNTDISFSNSSPLAGDNVRINAVIHGDKSTSQTLTRYGVVVDIGGAGEDQHVLTPYVMQQPDKTYAMWYAGIDAVTQKYSMMLAVSNDGIVWTKQGTVMGPGGPGEEKGPLLPHIIVDELGTYHMWYTGISASNHGSIFKAVSTDCGLTWQKQGLDLGYGSSVDPSGAVSPFVYFDGSIWHMWYGGVFWGSPDQSRINHAHKASLSDPWIKDGLVLDNDGPYDYPSASYPFVLPTGTGYEMYYTGYKPYSGPSRILHATSPDGITWTKTGIALEGTLPREYDYIASAHIIKVDGTVKYWYCGYDGINARIFYVEESTAKPGKDAVCTASFYLDSISESNLIDRMVNLTVKADQDTNISASWTAIPGSHNIIVDVTNVVPADSDPLNNAATASINVVQPNAPPVANAGPDISALVGGQITFDGTASHDPDGTIVSYDWDFGDGTVGTGPNPVHTYATAGTFKAALTVTDDMGAAASDTCQVTVTVPVVPSNPANLEISLEKTAGPGTVDVETCYGWTLEITVSNTGGSDALNVAAGDIISPELDLVSYSLSKGTLVTQEDLIGQIGSTILSWSIGTLVPGDSAVLTLTLSTGQDSNGELEFVSPGNYSLNAGAWATGTDSLTGDPLAAGPTAPIIVTAIDPDDNHDDNVEEGPGDNETDDSDDVEEIIGGDDGDGGPDSNITNPSEPGGQAGSDPESGSNVSGDIALPPLTQKNTVSIPPASMLLSMFLLLSVAYVGHARIVKRRNQMKTRELDMKLIGKEITEEEYLAEIRNQ